MGKYIKTNLSVALNIQGTEMKETNWRVVFFDSESNRYICRFGGDEIDVTDRKSRFIGRSVNTA